MRKGCRVSSKKGLRYNTGWAVVIVWTKSHTQAKTKIYTARHSYTAAGTRQRHADGDARPSVVRTPQYTNSSYSPPYSYIDIRVCLLRCVCGLWCIPVRNPRVGQAARGDYHWLLRGCRYRIIACRNRRLS